MPSIRFINVTREREPKTKLGELLEDYDILRHHRRFYELLQDPQYVEKELISYQAKIDALIGELELFRKRVDSADKIVEELNPRVVHQEELILTERQRIAMENFHGGKTPREPKPEFPETSVQKVMLMTGVGREQALEILRSMDAM